VGITTANTTFKGGKWQNFTSGIGVGTVGAAILEDIEVTNMFNVGMALMGTNSRATRCHINSIGSLGILSAGSSPANISNITIEYCKVSNCNTRHLATGIDSGAVKILFVNDQTVSYNWIDANYGNGLWWDTRCYDLLVEENVVENQFNNIEDWQDGIVLEEINGGTIVRHNALFNNGSTSGDLGFSQLAVSRSNATLRGATAEILITKNLFDCTDGREAHIGLFNSSADPNLFCKGIQVIDNDISMRHATATSKVGSSTTTIDAPATYNNFFLGNKYHVTSLSLSMWHWDTTMFTPVSWASWQALGHDSDASGATRVVI